MAMATSELYADAVVPGVEVTTDGTGESLDALPTSAYPNTAQPSSRKVWIDGDWVTV